MDISAIAWLYWKKVKNKEHDFKNVHPSKQNEVRALANSELNSAKITQELYNEIFEL